MPCSGPSCGNNAGACASGGNSGVSKIAQKLASGKNNKQGPALEKFVALLQQGAKLIS